MHLTPGTLFNHLVEIAGSSTSRKPTDSFQHSEHQLKIPHGKQYDVESDLTVNVIQYDEAGKVIPRNESELFISTFPDQKIRMPHVLGPRHDAKSKPKPEHEDRVDSPSGDPVCVAEVFKLPYDSILDDASIDAPAAGKDATRAAMPPSPDSLLYRDNHKGIQYFHFPANSMDVGGPDTTRVSVKS